MIFDGWIQTFDAWVAAVGPWGYPALGGAALIEYVAPPFPGDTIVLLGGAYAARGERSPALVLLAVTLGSMLGTTIMWSVGRMMNRSTRDAKGVWAAFLTRLQPSLQLASTAMNQHGTKILLFHRFLPTLRAVTLLAAGASGLPYLRVLVFGTVSAVAWNAVLVGVGMTIGHHAEVLEQWIRGYKITAMLVVVAIVVLWLWWMRHQRRRASL
jgi:membrane protein DedA with SNARE-associated domain